MAIYAFYDVYKLGFDITSIKVVYNKIANVTGGSIRASGQRP
jgi:hypothetical protein